MQLRAISALWNNCYYHQHKRDKYSFKTTNWQNQISLATLIKSLEPVGRNERFCGTSILQIVEFLSLLFKHLFPSCTVFTVLICEFFTFIWKSGFEKLLTHKPVTKSDHPIAKIFDKMSNFSTQCWAICVRERLCNERPLSSLFLNLPIPGPVFSSVKRCLHVSSTVTILWRAWKASAVSIGV